MVQFRSVWWNLGLRWKFSCGNKMLEGWWWKYFQNESISVCWLASSISAWLEQTILTNNNVIDQNKEYKHILIWAILFISGGFFYRNSGRVRGHGHSRIQMYDQVYTVICADGKKYEKVLKKTAVVLGLLKRGLTDVSHFSPESLDLDDTLGGWECGD